MLQSLRILVTALMSAIVVIAVALGIVLGGEDDAFAVTPLLALPLVLGVASHLASELVGYRLQPVPPGTPRDEAEQASREAYMSGTVLRFALSEAVAILCIALAFVVTDGGYLRFLVAGVVALVLMAVHCWPWERPVARSEASLERTGGESYLREAYGFPARPGGTGGVIREL